MNAGTCWGNNTIDPEGRSVEKAQGSDFNFNFNIRNIVNFLSTLKGSIH
jgi:hypothetical protein